MYWKIEDPTGSRVGQGRRHISEAKGIAVAPDVRLVVSDAAGNRLNLYDPEAGLAYLGSVPVEPGDASNDPVTVAGGLAFAPNGTHWSLPTTIMLLTQLISSSCHGKMS